MSVFSSRSPGYKGGVVLLFFATVVFIVGYAAPYWADSSGSNGLASYSLFQGLWMVCGTISFLGTSNFDCAAYAWEDIEGAFHAIRALNSLCLIGLLASCIYALATNCCRALPGQHNRVLEILAGLSGLVGFVGCMVFVGTIKQDELPSFQSMKDNIHFGFYLAAIGSGSCVIAAIIIALNNTPVEGSTQGNVYTVPMTTLSQGQGQGQPAAGGNLYSPTPAQPSGNAQSPGHYPQTPGNYPQSYGYYPQSYGNYPQSYGYPAAM